MTGDPRFYRVVLTHDGYDYAYKVGVTTHLLDTEEGLRAQAISGARTIAQRDYGTNLAFHLRSIEELEAQGGAPTTLGKGGW